MYLEKKLKETILQSETFMDNCRIGDSWEFLPHIGAEKSTLYSSAFAAMTYSYTGKLNRFTKSERQSWASFFEDHQSEEDGLFESFEVLENPGELHNIEHRKLHLTCHVLPALSLLGSKPKYRIKYIEKYKRIETLEEWLNKVDLSKSWIEGNNLLFMGQILWYEFHTYNDKYAKSAFDYLIQWLNKTVDDKTGLWGTNHGCPIHPSMFGSYHQLILYFHQKITPKHLNKLVDSTLLCQHFDGGFNSGLGGGTCQDIDGIDILVKATQCSTYRSADIEYSLRRALSHILRDRKPEGGGFFDSPGRDFIHNSMPATATHPNVANTFSTWFTIHAIANIAPVINLNLGLGFNNTLSMGWGENNASLKSKSSLLQFYINCKSYINEVITFIVVKSYRVIKKNNY
jgi:hypothetical protein